MVEQVWLSGSIFFRLFSKSELWETQIWGISFYNPTCSSMKFIIKDEAVWIIFRHPVLYLVPRNSMRTVVWFSWKTLHKTLNCHWLFTHKENSTWFCVEDVGSRPCNMLQRDYLFVCRSRELLITPNYAREQTTSELLIGVSASWYHLVYFVVLQFLDIKRTPLRNLTTVLKLNELSHQYLFPSFFVQYRSFSGRYLYVQISGCSSIYRNKGRHEDVRNSSLTRCWRKVG